MRNEIQRRRNLSYITVCRYTGNPERIGGHAASDERGAGAGKARSGGAYRRSAQGRKPPVFRKGRPGGGNHTQDHEAGDGSGKIYGLGHAVYTVSDPRARLLRKYAVDVAEEKGFMAELNLLSKVEELGVPVLMKEKNLDMPVCANVDLYTGLIYRMLGIPEELCTPLFAVARISGWCAHRIEEVLTGGRLMRPAYRASMIRLPYVDINDRT